jgi:hypothetical protein
MATNNAKENFTVSEKKEDGKKTYGLIRPLSLMNYDNILFYKALLGENGEEVCKKKFLAKLTWETTYLSFSFKSPLDAKNCGRHLEKMLKEKQEEIGNVPRHHVEKIEFLLANGDDASVLDATLRRGFRESGN